MTLKLYYHPLSNFCQKALISLYESNVDFTPVFIDLGNESDRAKLGAVWPMVKFPVLVDEARGESVPEATIIIEYLNDRHPAAVPLIPAEKDAARTVRLMDRFFDLHVNQHMFAVVSDRLKPEERKDPAGVEEAKAKLAETYAYADGVLKAREWAAGNDFSMADCAAAPTLYYANRIVPFGEHKNLAAYFERLMKRPSFARVFEEAEPYRHLFPAG
ncbi:glutathione S-transferase family protein [Parvibaculum sp.]|uniref:glutathione S-transferase family protein n=1 Tax=Parvibaculum sp. TaxID=2024848 RepID=UPI001AFF586C|nr:glutathione S-transferase family protein [Parvibaculum sp.]MBO6669660.1 glutathione S-transferase family protein [Parvibaculum sp.]MBO6692701.1 glutathione S-transferase family protein [Parvibaculum sp.]MBO6716204.1 glutathione S-transferase family protein [Parvibaculum sp.]